MIGALVAFAAVVAIVVIAWWRALDRISRLEGLIQQLVARVYALENAARPEPAPQPPPLPVPPPLVEEVAPAPVPPRPSTARDWESIIGANWLNKLGALLLVVGIALFLAFSLTYFGPAGKVAIGFSVGMSMLLAGVILEPRRAYSTFARGFIGGGWAAVYFTTYAMHALPAARLVENAAVGTALLLGVAVLMLAHSFRYRQEPVTLLAYFIGFATLNLTPLTGFTVVASLFLALSLVAVAYRLSWHKLAVAGVLFTYGTFAITYEPAVYGRSGLLNGQSLLWIYWIVFEAYDLTDVARRGRDRGIERALFLLNLCGFVGAMVLHQWEMRTGEWALYFALAALAYLVSTALRARMLRPLRDANFGDRLLGGGYEGAAAASAGLAAVAIVHRFDGLVMTTGLFIEAEMIVLAGLALKDRFVILVGDVAMALPLTRLLLGGFGAARWTPLASAMAVVFYVNHVVLRSGWAYPALGSVLLLAVSWNELSPAVLTSVWAAALAAIAYAAVFLNRRDLRWQAYVLALLVALRAMLATAGPAFTRSWAGAAGVVAIVFAHVVLREPLLLPLGAVSAVVLLAREIHSGFVTVAWGVLAAALVAAGFLLRDRTARLTGLAVFLLSIGRLFVYDLRQLDTMSRILSFIVLGLILLGASWVYTRYREQIRRIL